MFVLNNIKTWLCLAMDDLMTEIMMLKINNFSGVSNLNTCVKYKLSVFSWQTKDASIH